ncbi:MAG: hypothetical protein WAQ25_01755 [Candidatus Saccharimonas sp.]
MKSTTKSSLPLYAKAAPSVTLRSISAAVLGYGLLFALWVAVKLHS